MYSKKCNAVIKKHMERQKYYDHCKEKAATQISF